MPQSPRPHSSFLWRDQKFRPSQSHELNPHSTSRRTRTDSRPEGKTVRMALPSLSISRGTKDLVASLELCVPAPKPAANHGGAPLRSGSGRGGAARRKPPPALQLPPPIFWRCCQSSRGCSFLSLYGRPRCRLPVRRRRRSDRFGEAGQSSSPAARKYYFSLLHFGALGILEN